MNVSAALFVFAVDPRLPANRGIIDLDRAPQDKDHCVEFSANFYILQPKDAARANGTAFVEVSNRGGKGLLPMFNFAHGSTDPRSSEDFGDGFLLERGFTLVWIGWEFDVPDTPGLLKLDAPVATDHGEPITGLVRAEWTGQERVSTISLGDRSQKAYAVADPDDPDNKLYVRDQVDGARTLLSRSSWQFANATHVTLSAGFEPGRIYEVVYRAKDPVVAGLGFAAVRDFTAYLKHGAGKELGDEQQRSKRAIALVFRRTDAFCECSFTRVQHRRAGPARVRRCLGSRRRRWARQFQRTLRAALARWPPFYERAVSRRCSSLRHRIPAAPGTRCRHRAEGISHERLV